MQQWTIPLPNNYRFKESLNFLGRNDQECLHRIHHGHLYKLLTCDQALFLIKIFEEKKELKIDCLNNTPNGHQWQFIVEYVADWLDLTTDLGKFYQFAEKDPVLAPLVGSYFGLGLMGIPELFEALSWAIIGQQINLAFAYKLKRRWVENFGTKLMFDNQAYYLLPTPQQSAVIPDEALKQWQFSRQKIKYLKEIARLLSEGVLSKKSLQELQPAEIEKRLTRIKGVGTWTAHYVMMKCLRIPTAFPIQDVGLHQALKVCLSLDQKPAIDDIRQWEQRWEPWQAYACFYLWRSLIR